MNIFGPHAVDGYKLGHGQQDAEGLTLKYSNMTPRSNRLFKSVAGYDGKMVVFGIQGAWSEIVEIWNNSFFSQPKAKVMARYARRINGYLGPDVITYDAMAELHDLGYLPLSLKTLPEGSRVSMKVPIFTLKNTDPRFGWCVNYFETILSNMTWQSCVNATAAHEYKRLLTEYAIKTGSPLEGVQFQAHDFSARGMAGMEAATRSGAAHLTSFVGTDTVTAIDYLEDYYEADSDKEMIGVSVPATEHAVSSINILVRQRALRKTMDPSFTDEEIRLEAEMAFLKDLITKNHPGGIVSYVADTYDYWAVLTGVLPSLKEVIMARDGKLVIRPDSGDPVKIVCGMTPVFGEDGKAIDFADEDAAYDWLNIDDRIRDMKDCDCIKVGGTFYAFEANVYDDYTEGCGIDFDVVYPYEVVAGSIRTLWKTFGGTITETGHKLLDSHIGLIYGDSITLARAEAILSRLEAAGFASGNVVFGVGSFTYQYNTRDTFGTAMKATGAIVKDEFIEVYKDPKTSDGTKKSAKGWLRVEKDVKGDYILVDQVTAKGEEEGYLTETWRDGMFVSRTKLSEVRARLA